MQEHVMRKEIYIPTADCCEVGRKRAEMRKHTKKSLNPGILLSGLIRRGGEKGRIWLDCQTAGCE